MALSDTKIRKAQSADKDYKLADSLGLYLLVRTNGAKLWRMKYRVAGKEKLLALGRYPEVGLAQAREKRDEARKLLVEGRDPSLEKKRRALAARSAAAHDFESLARQWYELQKDRWSERYAVIVMSSFEADIFPVLGRLPIADIDAGMVLDALQRIERRGSIETAHRVRQRVSAVFVYAISRGLARSDPAATLNLALKPKRKVKPQPAITDIDQLRAMMRAMERSSAFPVTLLASRLLALTAVRPGVVRFATWSEFRNIDWNSIAPAPEAIWHIPAERMKLSQERKDEEAFDHIVPLAPQAIDALRAVRRLSGRADYVFPGQRHTHRPMSENAIGYLYNREGWGNRHVPHGWRAAFSTIMNEWAEKNGGPQDRAIIDLMLAHTPKDKIEGAYNRAKFFDRRRDLAKVWADLVMEGACPAEDLLDPARRK